jgi:hypothetical protein
VNRKIVHQSSSQFQLLLLKPFNPIKQLRDTVPALPNNTTWNIKPPTSSLNIALEVLPKLYNKDVFHQSRSHAPLRRLDGDYFW